MLIKASRITNLTDARYFAAKDVAYLGFNLEEGTPGYLDPMYMKAMREWVEGPHIVGEFSAMPLRDVRVAAAFYGLDAVQVRESVHGEDLATLEGVDIILEINVDRGFSRTMFKKKLRHYAPLVRYFLLDFSKTGITWGEMAVDAPLWKEICASFPVILQVDFPPERLAEIITNVNPQGLSLCGGEEERVGVKSFDDIDAVFDGLELE